MAQPPFVAVPLKALERRRELSQGAWDLYERYLDHRNEKTGQCNPSVKVLAREMKRTYKHVSDCKTELVEKGWIRRLGRYDVELLVGDFAPLKVIPLGRKEGGANSGKIRTSIPEKSGLGEANSGKIRTSIPEKSGTGAGALYEPTEAEPKAAAASAAVGASASSDPLREPVDDEFLEDVLAAGVYPAGHVRFVWQKLKLHCKGKKTEPVKKQLLHWLSTERHTPQMGLPGVGAEVSGAPLRVEDSAPRKCDDKCRLCYGTGYEVVPSTPERRGGARRCPNMQRSAQESPQVERKVNEQ